MMNDPRRNHSGPAGDDGYLLDQERFLLQTSGQSITREDLEPLTRFCRRLRLEEWLDNLYRYYSKGVPIPQKDCILLADSLEEAYSHAMDEETAQAARQAYNLLFLTPAPPVEEELDLFCPPLVDVGEFSVPPVNADEQPYISGTEETEESSACPEEDGPLSYPILIDQDFYETASGVRLTQEEIQEALDLYLRRQLRCCIQFCLEELGCKPARISQEILDQLTGQLFSAYAYHTRYDLLLQAVSSAEARGAFPEYRTYPVERRLSR